MEIIKSFKIRIYPNEQQKVLIEKHFGCCRFIYNYMLNLQNETYELKNEHLSYFDMNRLLKSLKKQEDYNWLSDVSCTSLQIKCFDLDKAFQGFFSKRKKYPRFKKKVDKLQTYPVCAGRFYLKCSKYLKIQKLGLVKYKTDYELPIGRDVKFINVRLTRVIDKYYVSFSLKCENQTEELNDYSVGIDLGIKKLAVVSYNGNSKVYTNINKSSKVRELEKDIKHISKSISRKYEHNDYTKTNNIKKLELQLFKKHRKLSNIRDNYIHQITNEIIKLKPKRVVMEDLNVSGMMKNRHLAKAVSDGNFYKFISYMKYKCEWNRIEFIQVDRFYPSSKTCSKCGTIKKDLKLSNRLFTCQKCSYQIDRDLNAAINLENYIN